MDMTAGVYARISDDRAGERLGVARQQADCEALAKREGWSVAPVYVDNDASAFSGRERPAYRRLLTDVAAGRVGAVIAWHPDRLHRSPRELEDFIDTVEKAGCQVRTVTAGMVDLSTASGRMTARVAAAVARHESEQKAERVRRKMTELAAAGKPNGGPRTFGYEPDHLTVREAEAELVREAAGRVLAGEALTAIARDWNARAVATVRNAADGWTYQALRGVLLSPRHAGLRTHHGEVVGPAVWPPIVAPDTHERLKATIRGRHASQPVRPRSRLLSGLARCGRCDARLYAKNGSGRSPTRVYRCVRVPGQGQTTACGRLSVVSDPADVEVGEQVLAALVAGDLAAVLAATASDGADHAAGELREVEERLDVLARDFADGVVTRREWLLARQRLTGRADVLRGRLTAATSATVLAGLPGTEKRLRAAWEAGDFTWRRAVVAALVDRVVVHPRGHTGKRFDPSRVSIVWRA